jgi:hypothetical protein
MARASRTKLVLILVDRAYPTTLQVHKSLIIAKYSHPWPVRMYVISEPQTALGVAAWKFRLRRLGAMGRLCLEFVVTLNPAFRFE